MTTDDPDFAPRAADRALDAGALRALAHPLRVQIYDIVSQYGPQTASTLAEMTGESSGATSYHLRALARHDLVREVAGRGSARERWWEAPPGPVSIGDAEALRSPSGRAAAQVVLAEFLTRRQAQLMRFVTESVRSGEDEGDDSLIATSTLRLTPAQSAELVGRLKEVIEDAVARFRDQDGEDVRIMTLRTDLFPLPPEGR